MSGENIDRAAREIGSEIRHAASNSHERVFYPEQFHAIAPLEEAIRAFAVLEGEGKLRLEAIIHCDESHTSWTGPPSEVATARWCKECKPKRRLRDPHVRIRGYVTTAWLDGMSPPSSEEKKTPTASDSIETPPSSTSRSRRSKTSTSFMVRKSTPRTSRLFAT